MHAPTDHVTLAEWRPVTTPAAHSRAGFGNAGDEPDEVSR